MSCHKTDNAFETIHLQIIMGDEQQSFQRKLKNVFSVVAMLEIFFTFVYDMRKCSNDMTKLHMKCFQVK